MKALILSAIVLTSSMTLAQAAVNCGNVLLITTAMDSGIPEKNYSDSDLRKYRARFNGVREIVESKGYVVANDFTTLTIDRSKHSFVAVVKVDTWTNSSYPGAPLHYSAMIKDPSGKILESPEEIVKERGFFGGKAKDKYFFEVANRLQKCQAL